MYRNIFVTLLATLAVVVSVVGQTLPEPMSPVRLVNDFASMFSGTEQSALERKLVGFADSTSTQIAVVTVSDLDGAAISDYATRLFDKWGVGGSSKTNNGILILIKPKSADSRGEVFITTGYGVEGAIPDALAGRIVDYDILPAFREGDFYHGVDQAIMSVMALTRGEYTADEYMKRKASEKKLPMSSVIFMIVFGLFFVAAMVSGAKSNGSRHTISSAGDVASAILLGSLLSGGHHRGGSGGFGGFSGGGGGFGGFGGGFSGGGGAGGSW